MIKTIGWARKTVNESQSINKDSKTVEKGSQSNFFQFFFTKDRPLSLFVKQKKRRFAVISIPKPTDIQISAYPMKWGTEDQ